MHVLNGFRTGGLLLAVAALAGCAGGGTPSTSQPLMPAVAAGASPIAPHAKAGDLLYVSDLNRNAVYIYTYPDAKLVGKLTGFSAPHGECSDAAGNVFIANERSQEIFEYAHGGTRRIATLEDPGYFPINCAVDPTTGNLAVTNMPLASSPGDVAIYPQAKGKPHLYTAPNIFFYYFAAYDRKGNLFVNGTQQQHAIFEFAELPAGSKAWKSITLEHHFNFPSAIQWIGSELVVGDQVDLSGPSTVYEFSLAGSLGKLTGQTWLADSCDVLQFEIDGDRLIAADDCGATVRYFAFPKGGNATKVVSDGLSQPVGITISRAP